MSERLTGITALTQSGKIWQGYQVGTDDQRCRTQYAALDQKLAGGFPEQGVIEIRTMAGIGELRLIFPYLSEQQAKGLIAFIAPPGYLSAESLQFGGLVVDNVLVIDANAQEALWCAEQCLKSGCCASIVLWQESIAINQMRRLTLACEQGQASLFLYRTIQTRYQFALPVKLALTLSSDERGLQVEITKQQGGRPSQPFLVEMNSMWPDLIIERLPENVIHFTAFNSRVS